VRPDTKKGAGKLRPYAENLACGFDDITPTLDVDPAHLVRILA